MLFQPKVKERHRTNTIKRPRKVDGSSATTRVQLEEEAIAFYTNLFTAQDNTDLHVVTA